MKYSTDAINIKSYNLNEADKIVVMYSKDHGLIRCVAKGVKSSKSKIGGRMDLLIANKLMLSKGKNMDTVCQAEGIATFKELRTDFTKLTYAIHCAELINNFGMENDQNSSNTYELFFKTLNDISKSKNNCETIWNVIKFQLKLMKFIGYAVELNTCVRCNDKIGQNNIKFCPESGGVVCCNCSSGAFGSMDLNEDILKALRKAEDFDLFSREDYYKDSTVELTLNYCFNILKKYVSHRSHKKIKSTELIECLC